MSNKLGMFMARSFSSHGNFIIIFFAGAFCLIHTFRGSEMEGAVDLLFKAARDSRKRYQVQVV